MPTAPFRKAATAIRVRGAGALCFVRDGIMKLSARALLAEVWRVFRASWPQLIAADLVARILALALLTPLCGLLLHLFLKTTATGVVADTAIVSFLLHPAGLAALIVCGSISLAILLAE